MADVTYAGPIIKNNAGEALGGNRAVVLINNLAYYADKDTLSHASKVRGITTAAAILGAEARIQVAGIMYEASWSWTPDLPLYVGSNGLLTQTVPTSGFVFQIAIANTANTIQIDPKIPILQ